ncbi:hypothetical protein M4I21_06995 [Cellulophaga sp. 20_2_10]|uniref:hypothetical protein n=1 Tax=Cellulophaga sp. 20_2_10 TaxID=2942476 RepID=UPI00201A2E97|nr:hypothetical protein [Cellulophaga sp. 20_2_10]MCL5245547.1 hypothetical protein [Cellulophaga sp. 20_2_10]
MEKILQLIDKYKYLVFAFLLLCVIISPYLFTRESFLGISFDETGAIGDTIGGITSPFVNLLAAFLVYLSFREQTKSNKEQIENNNQSYIYRLLDDVLKNKIYTEENFFEGYKNALSSVNLQTNSQSSDDLKNIHFHKVDDLINSVNFLIFEIENKLKDEKLQKFYLSKISLFLSRMKVNDLIDEFKKIKKQENKNSDFHKYISRIDTELNKLNEKLKFSKVSNTFFTF